MALSYHFRNDPIPPPWDEPPDWGDVPLYGESRNVPQGLYLGLFNGVRGLGDWPQDKDDWGFNGPMIGPLVYVHTTYASDLKLEFVNESDAARYKHLAPDDLYYDIDLWLHIYDDCVQFHGCQFGDWTVFLQMGGGEVEIHG